MSLKWAYKNFNYYMSQNTNHQMVKIISVTQKKKIKNSKDTFKKNVD